MTLAESIRANRPCFEDFITRSTYHSNAIEGNTLSFAETYAILFNDNSMPIKATARELYEAINHKYAIDYLFRHMDEPLTEKMVKDLAQIINKNINEISGYRTGPVFIRGAEHIPPAPQMVPQQMMYFVYNYNHTEYSTPYQRAAASHIEFERIHPFSDGNGRTGRLLVNYELIKNGLAPVVIPFELRGKYMELLAECNTSGLAGMFQTLSVREQERMQAFQHAPSHGQECMPEL